MLRYLKIRRLLFSAVLYAVSMTAVANASAGVVVVVSARSPIFRLTTGQVANIFLAKSTAFPGGQTAMPLDQAEGAALRYKFYEKVTGKDGAQLKAYWGRIIFAGDGQPPRMVANDAGVKKVLAGNPNAIGYIDSASVDDSVRVVLAPLD